MRVGLLEADELDARLVKLLFDRLEDFFRNRKWLGLRHGGLA